MKIISLDNGDFPMNKLLVLTFADKPLDDTNRLRTSCEENGVSWKALTSTPWIQNIIKLKMLYEFVSQNDPEQILLIVDAYDVLIYANEGKILEYFKKENTDILFSGESNFMYKEPAKWLAFLLKYPSQPTIYQYLNSGSYMGKSKHIKLLLEEIQNWFKVDLLDEEKLLPLKSDQYLLSRFYVENQLKSRVFNLKIDSDQSLLGCTGGRFCVLKFPDLGKWQAFTHFIIERNLLKMFSLHKHQKVSKDYILRNGKFFNKKMQCSPLIMHFPGTWDRFNQVYEDLLENKKAVKSIGWFLAALVSLVAYPLSIFFSVPFLLMNRQQ